MTRFLILLALTASACGDDDGDGGPDAAMDATKDAAGRADAPQDGPVVDAAPNCIPEQSLPPLPHASGSDCLSCHDGSGARLFTAAGTVYTDVWGSDPVAGATVVLLDSSGAEIFVITAGNGSFHTSVPLHASFPERVTRCPYDIVADSPGSSGACNGCHGPGNRIHVP